MKNFSTFEPQIEKHYAYKKRVCPSNSKCRHNFILQNSPTLGITWTKISLLAYICP